VAGEDFDVDFFTALEADGERGVVVAVEEAQGRGFDGGDEDRFSNGSTSWAGKRTTRSGSMAPVSSQPALSAGSSASAVLLSATTRMTGLPAEAWAMSGR
jgi:hypothetical protein